MRRLAERPANLLFSSESSARLARALALASATSAGSARAGTTTRARCGRAPATGSARGTTSGSAEMRGQGAGDDARSRVRGRRADEPDHVAREHRSKATSTQTAAAARGDLSVGCCAGRAGSRRSTPASFERGREVGASPAPRRSEPAHRGSTRSRADMPRCCAARAALHLRAGSAGRRARASPSGASTAKRKHAAATANAATTASALRPRDYRALPRSGDSTAGQSCGKAEAEPGAAHNRRSDDRRGRHGGEQWAEVEAGVQATRARAARRRSGAAAGSVPCSPSTARSVHAAATIQAAPQTPITTANTSRSSSTRQSSAGSAAAGTRGKVAIGTPPRTSVVHVDRDVRAAPARASGSDGNEIRADGGDRATAHVPRPRSLDDVELFGNRRLLPIARHRRARQLVAVRDRAEPVHLVGDPDALR